MTKPENGASKTLLARMQARAHRGRGAIYKWLLRNHAKVQRGFDKTEATWDSVVETMIAEKVKGRGGALPNSKSVARVWVRVCRDVAAARESQPRRRAPPNRSRPDSAWVPAAHPVATSRSAVEPRLSPSGRGSANDAAQLAPSGELAAQPGASIPKKKMTFDDLPPEAKAQIERLRQDLAETDRKRFGRF